MLEQTRRGSWDDARSQRLRLCLLGTRFWLLLFLGGVVTLPAANFVAVNATAVSEYVRPMTAQGEPRAESYVFAEGQHFRGKTSDTSLAETEFSEIIQVLAPPLAKQNYFPTKEVNDANLLLMVHWGTTRIFEDPLKESLVENTNNALNEYRAVAEPNGIADPSVLNAAILDQRYASAGTHGAIARNAALLGYKTTLQREQQKLFPSPEEQTMNEELREERYFIIVMAFDNQLLRKEKKSRLLWITRMSVRSPGNKFEQAIPAIAQAGAEVYGRHIDGLVRVKANARGGQVNLGDLKTVGPDHGAVPIVPGK